MSKKVNSSHFTLDRNRVVAVPDPKTDAKDALAELRAMAYRAAVRMEEILRDQEIPDGAKLPLVNIVLDRVYGKPEEMLTIQSNERAVEESATRLQSIAEKFQKRSIKTLEHSQENTGSSEEESNENNGPNGTEDE